MAQILDIVNAALTKIGDRPIASLEDDLPQADTISLRYQQVFDFVATQHPFKCLLSRRILAQDATYTKVAYYDYSFPLPNDCAAVLEVYDSDGDRYYDWEQEGEDVLANVSDIRVKYTKEVTDNVKLTPDVAELMAIYLAKEIARRRNPENEDQRVMELNKEYKDLLAVIRTKDSRRSAPRHYGPFDPYSQDANDDPLNILDSRVV